MAGHRLGDNYSGQTLIPPARPSVGGHRRRRYHNLALRADGTVVGWGYHDTGRHPRGCQQLVAIAAGDYYGFALRADGVAIAGETTITGQVSIPTACTT